MPDQKVILSQLIDELKETGLLRKIQQIILFGSRARGDADPRSDFDLAFKCPNLSDSDWQKILECVDDLPTLLKFDIVRMEEASPPLQANIYQEGKVLYEKH